ncbi:hypothetical protein ACB458_003839 [Morganella morganii]|nr:hypothetical protein [Morganella morganii]
MPDTITLTLEQIRALADFAAQEGQPSYTITTGIIPAFDDQSEYQGLIAFSGSEEHGVLQLG